MLFFFLRQRKQRHNNDRHKTPSSSSGRGTYGRWERSSDSRARATGDHLHRGGRHDGTCPQVCPRDQRAGHHHVLQRGRLWWGPGIGGWNRPPSWRSVSRKVFVQPPACPPDRCPHMHDTLMEVIRERERERWTERVEPMRRIFIFLFSSFTSERRIALPFKLGTAASASSSASIPATSR